MSTPLFPLGQIVATTGSLAALEKNEQSPLEFIGRHIVLDPGQLCEEDQQSNKEALELGNRILSSYLLKDQTTIWVITEADRSVTTLLLPEEY